METRKPRVRYKVALMAHDMAARGWLNTDLARAADLSDMTVTRWFTGQHRTARTAEKLARALGQPLGRYLFAPGAERRAS